MIQQICLILVAAANIASAVALIRFVKEFMPLLRSIDRAARTVKTDTLLRRLASSKSGAEERRGLHAIPDEDLLEMIPHKLMREFLKKIDGKAVRNEDNT